MADAASKDAEMRLADALVAQQKLEKELEEVRSDMEELRASKVSSAANSKCLTALINSFIYVCSPV